MGNGAVITINNPTGIQALVTTDIFSEILEPVKKAESSGRIIKSELKSISANIDVVSLIDRAVLNDGEDAELRNNISENAQEALNQEETVYGALTNVEGKLTEFGKTVIDVEKKAYALIKERKLEFNETYPELESEQEYRERMNQRSAGEKASDFFYGYIHGGFIGGFDSLINGRERFDAHVEAIKEKIAEIATKTWEWVKENWEAIVTAILVVAAAIVCIATFGAGTVFLVASLAALAYSIADKIVAINNNGNGIVATLEANGHHHLSQFFKGFKWGLDITIIISGMGVNGATSLGKVPKLAQFAKFNSNVMSTFNKVGSAFNIFKGSGFWASLGNEVVHGMADDGIKTFLSDTTAYKLNFLFSKDAQANPLEYFKNAAGDTVKDVFTDAAKGGLQSAATFTFIKGADFFKSKFITPDVNLKVGEQFNISKNGDGTFDVNGKILSKEDIINPDTAEFKYKYGEMDYNSDDVFNNLYQKNNISNQQSRLNIQRNAVDYQIKQNPDYFKQFGCNETSTNKIVDWFQKNDSMSLHETLNNKVQIVPKNLNAVVDHAGGTSLETLRINSANNYEKYISDFYHNDSSPLKNITIGEMQDIYKQFDSKLYNPSNYNIDSLKGRGKENFISEIFGFDIP